MRLKKLKVPFLEQRPYECGPTCVRMVLGYYGKHGKDISANEMLKLCGGLKKLKVGYGVFQGNLGIAAMKLGFKVERYDYNVSFYDSSITKLPKKKMKKELKKARARIKGNRDMKRSITSTIRYIEQGGKFVVKPMGEKDIIRAIKKRTPPILCLKGAHFYNKNKIKWGHYVVVSGFEKDKFIVNDPHTKISKIQKEKLLAAWYFYGAPMIIIKK